jgi:hypothetical protein
MSDDDIINDLNSSLWRASSEVAPSLSAAILEIDQLRRLGDEMANAIDALLFNDNSREFTKVARDAWESHRRARS